MTHPLESQKKHLGADAAAVETARSAEAAAAAIARHTQGPWKAEGVWEAEGSNGGWSVDAGDVEVAFLYHTETRTDAEADANLIAASPELLEALRDMVASYDGLRDVVTSPVVLGKLAKADAAIAKAEGR
jgi:hypothetical protein